MNNNNNKKKKLNPGGGGGGGGSTCATATTPGGPDRISELPLEILHSILGYLDMDEFLIRTSLVSTHWRNLWKSVPVLKFYRIPIRRRIDDDIDGGIITNPEKYHNFMHHVLRLRDSQASSIKIFKYYCDVYSQLGYDYLECLHNFIVSAVVNQGAEEIEIRGSYSDRGDNDNNNNNNMIHFNPSIFTSLRKFTFSVLNSHYRIQFPRSMCCATQLTHLSLYGIRLPEGDDSNDELHLVCPLLETFHMSYCSSEHLKVLDISAPRLDTLSISNYSFMRFVGFDFLGGCRIEIRTPNLTSLAYKGRVYVDCFTVNLPRIADASLEISEEPGMVKKTTSFAIKLLKGLTSAESLTLEGFEVFSQDTLKVLLTPFTSLRTLELVSSCKISSIHGMVYILNGSNSIEKLVWNLDRYYYDTVKGDEHLMLPQCRLSHLKHVHIKNLRGREIQIEFVKFLLKSSVVLEDLIIDTHKNSSKILLVKEILKQFIEEEPSVRRSIKLYAFKEEVHY